MSRFGLLFRGVFIVSVALYPFLVFFGLRYLPPGTLALVLALFLAFRFGVLTAEEKPVVYPMLVVLMSFAVLVAFLDSQRLLLAYPALVNLFLAITFASSLRDGSSILLSLVKARKVKIGEYVPRYLARLTLVWVFFFVVNGLIAVWTSMQSMELWVIYNGLISYIAAGFLIIGELIFRIYYKKRMGVTGDDRT